MTDLPWKHIPATSIKILRLGPRNLGSQAILTHAQVRELLLSKPSEHLVPHTNNGTSPDYKGRAARNKPELLVPDNRFTNVPKAGD